MTIWTVIFLLLGGVQVAYYRQWPQWHHLHHTQFC